MIKFRVKQEPPTIDDTKLINLVKNNIFLFDVRNPDYRNLPLRASVWASIANDLKIGDREFYEREFYEFYALTIFIKFRKQYFFPSRKLGSEAVESTA